MKIVPDERGKVNMCDAIKGIKEDARNDGWNAGWSNGWNDGNLKGVKLERKVIRALTFRLKNFNFILKTRKSGRWILSKPVT